MIVAVSTLALIVSNGLAIGGIPVFYRPLRDEFVSIGAIDATRAESFIALGASITFMSAGFLSPLAGWLIGRFPIRYLMAAGCVLLGAGLGILSSTASPLAVYVARFLMGFRFAWLACCRQLYSSRAGLYGDAVSHLEYCLLARALEES